MKSMNTLVCIALILSLCNCGGTKQHKPVHKKKSKKVTQIDMPIIGDNKKGKESNMFAFNEDIGAFEDIEAFVLEEDDNFGSFVSSELDDGTLLAYNDPSNINFTWEAVEEDAQKTFETIFFGYDNSRISKDERPKIAKNIGQAEKLIQEGKTIVCKGKSCKWGGTEVYNLAISDQRAQSVARELKGAGIAENHIKAFGVGTKEATASGNSKEAHATDRCVELYTLTI